MSQLEVLEKFQRRMYEDGKLRGDLLLLGLTMARVLALEEPKGFFTMARRAAEMIGWDARKLHYALQKDLPRYDKFFGESRFGIHNGPCEAPRLRPPGRICGQYGGVTVEEWDVRDGTLLKVHYFCSRHKAEAKALEDTLPTRGEIPRPQRHNVGGNLMPYFKADWLRIYTDIEESWKPLPDFPGYQPDPDEAERVGWMSKAARRAGQEARRELGAAKKLDRPELIRSRLVEAGQGDDGQVYSVWEQSAMPDRVQQAVRCQHPTEMCWLVRWGRRKTSHPYLVCSACHLTIGVEPYLQLPPDDPQRIAVEAWYERVKAARPKVHCRNWQIGDPEDKYHGAECVPEAARA